MGDTVEAYQGLHFKPGKAFSAEKPLETRSVWGFLLLEASILPQFVQSYNLYGSMHRYYRMGASE